MEKLKLLIIASCFPVFLMAQTKEKPIEWIGKSNRIANPGAEANYYGKPELWQSDFTDASESNWVSEYGTTSHEWNHGDKKLGLPPNPGNNYFRLNVNRFKETRKANIFQEIPLADLSPVLKQDTVIAVFHVDIASNYNTPKNCSFAEVKVLFFNSSGAVVDSIYVKRLPNEFRDLDAGTPEAEERGFNVMHEFKPFSANKRVSQEVVKARLEAYCEFPCNKFVNEDEEESEAENSNTFFFDNFSLGFYKK